MKPIVKISTQQPICVKIESIGPNREVYDTEILHDTNCAQPRGGNLCEKHWHLPRCSCPR
jgi:hypothetical protein